MGDYVSYYMGSKMSCDGLCDGQRPAQTPQVDNLLLVSEYLLPCQICGLQIVHSQFKRHIDMEHYSTIAEREQSIFVYCILCENASDSLQLHGRHLREKHPYLQSSEAVGQSVEEERKRQRKLYREIKDEMEAIEHESKFEIIGKLPGDKLLGRFNGEQYAITIARKEYTGLQYSQTLSQAELVWWPVFQQAAQDKHCDCYYLDSEPGSKSIVCTSMLFYRLTELNRDSLR